MIVLHLCTSPPFSLSLSLLLTLIYVLIRWVCQCKDLSVRFLDLLPSVSFQSFSMRAEADWNSIFVRWFEMSSNMHRSCHFMPSGKKELANREKRVGCSSLSLPLPLSLFDRLRVRAHTLVHSLMLSEFPVVHPPSVSCRTHALDVDCYSNHSRRLMNFFFSPVLFRSFVLSPSSSSLAEEHWLL